MPTPALDRSPLRGASRPAFRAARAFYLTLFLGACFATYALLVQSSPSSALLPRDNTFLLRKRDGLNSTLINEDEQCRLVHHAEDQCAFVHAQCPNDEAGFAAYLDLYYCKLPHLKAIGLMILISWLGLLFSTIGIAASDFFCINLSTIATILGMSESMAGVTFLAFGNGSPDVFSTFAAMSTNSGSLAVGELFGAAGFITAVVSGSMALIRPFHVARKSFIRDVGFFVVAAAFSIVFLWDGRLHLWECIAMVVYYCFYVAFVVAWHWWLTRRRRRKEQEAVVRGHFIPPDEHDMEEHEYHDVSDDPSTASRTPAISPHAEWEEWSALERGADEDALDEDEEEEARDRWMSELNSNMRLTRGTARSRKNTLTPVRPSLVGALEFQAVLKALQKSRNIQTYPMNPRRFSDDPTYTTAQQQDVMSSPSDPAARPPYQVTVHHDGASPTMERRELEVPNTAPPLMGQRSFSAQAPSALMPPKSPSFEVSPATPRHEAPIHTRHSSTRSIPRSPDLLAPPQGLSVPRSTGDINVHTPRAVPHARQLPKIIIPGRERSNSRSPRPSPMISPMTQAREIASSPFPRYHDDPATAASSRLPDLHLPPPISPESLPVSQSAEQVFQKSPTFTDRWWPHAILPPPGVLISTLFPTIYHWHDKNYWEKALGIVAAPSVFLLTITLPVVESGKDDDGISIEIKGESYDSNASRAAGQENSVPFKDAGTGKVLNDPVIHIQSRGDPGAAGQGTAKVAANTEQQHGHLPSNAGDHHNASVTVTEEPEEDEATDNRPELWNRWLLIIQLFLAPLFIVFAIYTQSPIDIAPSWLIKPILISLLISVVLLIPLFLTTTPTHKPAIYRYILSLVGFTVSIAWISTIASQVVGALKALAVILNMSHAIMGLTIFAVGNSLGDLVADVTVARLGYPVMALSACFGGPMLNILLGIGLSGSYILITGAQHRGEKHPGEDLKFKTYHIEVSNTLIVSGMTLLVTLVGLLIAVPLNRWVFSKRIGWTLIAVWVLSTVGNVVVELTGLAER
ncbi:Sodium/calcium exchanger protein-domain-containing protein [Neohortaea acidophila]|uniref:Sodium/calcium exchanger protein-domain-containing protein n=1 Tax=Neohortaea acidophila TaxID=245834 RepID=A0A6A6PLK8_9PEZI|nr:Sodium/calcium exchanger protein-domain-containing protein [Neohortaea acidophila]KAF2480581.1 Sodium/calcium exchanger protein-domain-containing protein [Neohortaea acidophila]